MENPGKLFQELREILDDFFLKNPGFIFLEVLREYGKSREMSPKVPGRFGLNFSIL